MACDSPGPAGSMTTRSTPRRSSTSLTGASGVFGLSSATGLAIIGAPWWIAMMVVIATLLCTLVQSVFPQESADRLEWWRDRRRTKTRERTRRADRRR